MRITGGKYKGRIVKCPKGVIRPAMDRMRESLFSILGNLNGHAFLDLFSGSGLVGIEASSRGAMPVVLVERDKFKRRVIKENTMISDDEIRIYTMTAQRYVKITRDKFDIVYVDPPFPVVEKQGFIKMLDEADILNENAKVIIHHPSEEEWPENIGSLKVTDRRKYGRSILLFFQKS